MVLDSPPPAVMDKGFTAAVREAAQVNGRPAPTVRGDAGIGPIVALRIEAGRPAAPIAPLSGGASGRRADAMTGTCVPGCGSTSRVRSGVAPR
ncbi:hypothetical protein [Streptomyces lavendulae]|uniref:hypothetical protein n=1 Tax=Streptomyces lavendulae TaxID=1914 RepID=UPI0024A10322|nr:hypothetical protein [Streptomyces lavendulae]GLW02795.1 hypothetical protein Slala05_64250 [Streptomyces lavendulae subsp. lavendulae]